jgi:hypothetical protein
VQVEGDTLLPQWTPVGDARAVAGVRSGPPQPMVALGGTPGRTAIAASDLPASEAMVRTWARERRQRRAQKRAEATAAAAAAGAAAQGHGGMGDGDGEGDGKGEGEGKGEVEGTDHADKEDDFASRRLHAVRLPSPPPPVSHSPPLPLSHPPHPIPPPVHRCAPSTSHLHPHPLTSTGLLFFPCVVDDGLHCGGMLSCGMVWLGV